MSPDVWRCKSCGALALPFSHTHSRQCAYGVTPEAELVLALARLDRTLDRWIASSTPTDTEGTHR
jgi:hypothetical protein